MGRLSSNVTCTSWNFTPHEPVIFTKNNTNKHKEHIHCCSQSLIPVLSREKLVYIMYVKVRYAILETVLFLHYNDHMVNDGKKSIRFNRLLNASFGINTQSCIIIIIIIIITVINIIF
jgi:hypothetical protein